MVKNKHKAVVIGVNYYTGLSTVRSLGRENVHVVACEYDKDAYGLCSKYVSEILQIPDAKTDAEAMIQTLIDYGKKQEIKPVLLPTHDNYVAVVDAHLPELKKYYLFPMNEQGLWTRVMHKNSLAEMASQWGVKTPKYYSIDDNLDFNLIAQEIKYPCIIKPNSSSKFVRLFSDKVIKCKDETALKEALKTMKNNNLDGKVEQIIPGFDDHMFTYDAYVNQDGIVTHDATFQKLRQYPINFGASVYLHQINVPKIRQIGSQFLQDIGWRGFAEIEFKKYENTDDYYLIEINTRMTNFNALLEKLGLNMPYITYLEMTGQEIGSCHLTESTDMAFRYYINDLHAIKEYIETDQIKLIDALKNSRKKKVGAIFAWDDMKPTFKFLKNKIQKR